MNKLLDTLDLITPFMDFVHSIINDQNISEEVKQKAKQFLIDYENKLIKKIKGD